MYALHACPACLQRFDEAERAPRVLRLHCGHTFCSACLGARIRQESARKWCVAYPVDGEETLVPKGCAAKLGTASSLLSVLATLTVSAVGPSPFRVHIKNIAGDVWSLIVTTDDTIGDLKRRIRELCAECTVHLQRLLVPSSGDELIALLDDAATLGALGIGAEYVVSLVVRDGIRGVEHVRALGSVGSDDGQFNLPWDVCASVDGDHLFVTDFYIHRVQVVRASDGVHVRTIGARDNGASYLTFRRICAYRAMASCCSCLM